MSVTVVQALSGGLFAASNPIYLKLKRYDYDFDTVEEGTPEQGYDGKVVLSKSGGGDVEDYFQVGQTVRVVGSVIIGSYEVLAVVTQANVIIIDLNYDPSMSSDSGIIINSAEFPLQHIETEVYHDTELIATLHNSPNINGIVSIDFQRILKALLTKSNDYNYDDINILDENLSTYFTFRYREKWLNSDQVTPEPSWTALSSEVYVVNAAMQIGDYGGGNLEDYSIKDTNYSERVKFLTKFERPKIFHGYPFDISFYWWTYVAQPSMLARINIDRRRWTGAFISNDVVNLENDLGYGIHRFKINPMVAAQLDHLTVNMEAMPEATFKNCINELRIDYDSTCYDAPVYLCWLNNLGGWDYWLFHTYYTDNLDINQTSIMRKYISDYENENTQKDIVSRNPDPFLRVGADNLTNQQIEGLKGLLSSPKVMMLTNKDEWFNSVGSSPYVAPKWITVIVRDGSFEFPKSIVEHASIELEIELPTLNVQ